MESEQKKAIEIIGDLNFDKACKIICDRVAKRMPESQSEVFDREKKEALSKRDEVVNHYLGVFKALDSDSPNPELTKNQIH